MPNGDVLAAIPPTKTVWGIPLSVIIYTVVAFIIGYGGVASATGYRYSLVWDWNAVVAGLITTGIYHAPTKQ